MEDALSFQDVISRSTIDVPLAALSFARSLAYPTLDIEYYRSRLDALVEAARPLVDPYKSLEDQVDALSDFLFYQQNFQGNRAAYQDPRNSYLNWVLDNKRGIPISLSVIYVSIAQRLGLNAYGVGLPGHFIVGVYRQGSQVLIDPFNAGLRLTASDCARLVKESTGFAGAFQPKWLTAVSPVKLLGRMLSNLCNAYIQREDWRSAIPVIQHLLLVQPNTDFHLRDLGYLYMYNGSLRLSAQYLEEYLRRSPDADDFDNVRSSLQIVAGRLALWN